MRRLDIVAGYEPRWRIYRDGKHIGNASRLYMALLLAHEPDEVCIRIGSYVFASVGNG